MHRNRNRIVASLAAAALLASPAMASATIIKCGGSTGLQLLAQKLANAYGAARHVTVTVAGGGSGAGIKGASAGRFDIGDSSRDWKSGDPTGLTFTPVANEPFVVIVNPANPITSLTKAQVKAIFTGAVTNWKSLGWKKGGAIKVYSRIDTSGTLGTFKALFLDGANVTPTAPKLASNGLDRSNVAAQRNAISFVTYAYTVGTTQVRPEKIGGVAPTLRNVQNGSYKYHAFQYFVTKGHPTGAVATYINWVRSAAGARIVAGFALPTKAAAVDH